jgi:signal transduction histidine kinase/CheY-like chemotaxis protein
MTLARTTRPYSNEVLPDGNIFRRYENRYRHKDGSWRWISWAAVVVGDLLQGVGRDITAEKEQAAQLRLAEEQLRGAQKMEALGQLTGGIAHDFNNMLAVVIGSLGLIKRRLANGETNIGRFADSALDAASRAATMTHRLLAFSRQQPLKPEIVEPNRLVSGMSELLTGALGERIEVETVLAADPWRTQIDPHQLESALLNLAVNARDAMPNGGRLTVETANVALDARYAAQHPDVAAGDYVMVAMTDTGMGMDRATLVRAFDPFFTTKEVGKGTGLGLSQVYGFVRQSGGHVQIYSEVGQGTVVKLYLPRVGHGDAMADDGVSRSAARPPGAVTILIVEDDDAVRRLGVAALAELGYLALEADSASAALSLIDDHPEISLLFTDVVMPEINGRELVERALRRRPGLKVLYTTGYTRNAVVHNGVLDADVAMISKPFTIGELGAKLRAVLGE